jgi:retron-type reverse transcriptase
VKKYNLSHIFIYTESSDRVQLAKLVIAQNLGKERTIWLLWGVRPGGRNHNLYTEARAMLDRLINEEGNNNAQ